MPRLQMLQKMLMSASVVAVGGLLLGCDDLDREEVIEFAAEAPAQGGATVEEGNYVDEFELSIEEARGAELDDITSLPQPTAGICDGYNGWNYCFAKCGDGQWHLVGHASVIPYGHCTGAGDVRCGGWWNHFGSCWGNG